MPGRRTLVFSPRSHTAKSNAKARMPGTNGTEERVDLAHARPWGMRVKSPPAKSKANTRRSGTNGTGDRAKRIDPGRYQRGSCGAGRKGHVTCVQSAGSSCEVSNVRCTRPGTASHDRLTRKPNTRNHLAVQLVPGMRFLVFDFSVWTPALGTADTAISHTRNRMPGTICTENAVS
eukprot:3830320-Rhodomonas_salina.1